MGISLHVLRAGIGPRLLLLHGIGGSATAWNYQLQRLSPHFSCMAPDLPGYGESPAPQGEGLDAILVALVDLLEGEPAHVLGVSFGGLLALALAHRYPQLVRSLILSDATLGRADLPPAEKARWLAGREALSEELQARSLQRASEIAAPGAAPEVLAEISRHMRRARPEGYMAVARIIADTNARPWLPDIRQAALVICGEEDRVTGAQMSDILLRQLRHAQLHKIARAGHAPHIEQPDEFAAAVKDFLLA